MPKMQRAGAVHTFKRKLCYIRQSGNTNWLSAFVVDIGKVLFQHDTTKRPIHSLKDHVICYLVSLNECRLGEELFTRAGLGYYKAGLGFNIAPAGIAVSSANLGQEKHDVALERWRQCTKFRERDRTYERQLRNAVDVQLPKYINYARNNGMHRIQKMR